MRISLCQFIQAWSCRTTVCNKLYLLLVAFNVPVYSLFCSFVSPAVGSRVILSPAVGSRAIPSPVGSRAILSPAVGSRAILSPAVRS